MSDKLGYKQTEDSTIFTLGAGTELTFGSEVIGFPKDTEVYISKLMSRDAVVETIIGAGQSQANSQNFAYTETRDGVKYDVTYGARGQRRESAIEPEPKAPVTKPETKKPKKK